MSFSRVLILGCGYTGVRALRIARERGLAVTATTRSAERAGALRDEGADVLVAATLGAEIEAHLDRDTRVVITFPADPETDARVAPLLRRAHSATYISSTGVYGHLRGPVDDATPLPAASDPRSQRLQDAEARYRDAGATVLRSPAIYGPDRGLHVRVIRGEHKIPGDGAHVISRVHAHDLAQFTLSPAAPRGETFVVGDLAPAPHIEVVRFVCETYGVPMPEAVPPESLHASLRADRSVDPTRALAVLGVSLAFPTYREGMAPAATGIRPGALPG